MVGFFLGSKTLGSEKLKLVFGVGNALQVVVKMQQETDDEQRRNNDKTITPFCYPKANLINKQAILHERIGLKNIKNYDNLYATLFKSYKCWDTVPNSSKLIILDTGRERAGG